MLRDFLLLFHESASEFCYYDVLLRSVADYTESLMFHQISMSGVGKQKLFMIVDPCTAAAQLINEISTPAHNSEQSPNL